MTEPEAERDLARLRPRGRAAVAPIAGLLALVLLSFYFCAQFDSVFQRTVIVFGAAALAVLSCVEPLARWASIRYRITTRRVLARRGVMRVRRGEVAFASDLEVTVSRSLGQRLSRCGDVRIARGGGTVLVLRDLPDAELVAEVLRERIASSATPAWWDPA